jgi:hypothetical protein
VARIDERLRRFIVIQLASFRTPTEVVKDVAEQYDVSVSRQQVERYNPTRVAGKSVAKKWEALFHAARKTYLEDVARHGVAHRAYRMERLQRLLESHSGRNPMLVLQILSQAAQETVDAELEERLRQLERRLS